MRILIFSELFYPHGSGAELATWLYSNLLAKQGFKITVVTQQFPGERSIDSSTPDVTIYRLPIGFMSESRYYTLANFGVLISQHITDLIKQSDVIYVPCGWYSVIPFAKRYNKRVIVHLHNYLITCNTSLMYDFLEKKVKPSSRKSYILHEILERQRGSFSVAASMFMNEFIGKFYSKIGTLADVLVFVSQAQMDLAISVNPSIKEKSVLIYNPIPDVPLIPAKEFGCAYFGGKNFIKGYSVLIKALNCVHCSQKLKTYLTMTCNKETVSELGNGVSLNFLPKLSKVGLDRLMQDLSIVIIPSIWPEPAPYSLIESMLHGKIIVASNIGGIPEIVGKPSLGAQLIIPDDPFDLAKNLESLLALKVDEANELGLKNRDQILQNFNNDNAVSAFIDVVDKLLSN